MAIYRDVANWRTRTKQRLIAYKGGKCQKCGYDKIEFPRAFNFHHRDPDEKKFGIAASIHSWENLVHEVDKCDLLCVRCHAETHDSDDFLKRAHRAKSQRKRLLPRNCVNCQTEFLPHNRRQRFCKPTCSDTHKRKVVRPTKEQLLQDIETMPMVAVGAKYGVSDNAVRKWLRIPKR